MPPSISDPVSHVAGRELAVDFSEMENGTYDNLPGVSDYNLTEVEDSDVSDIVNPEGAFAVADLPAAGGCEFTIVNAQRHLSIWKTLIDAQKAATPLWCRISETNDREPCAVGSTTFTVAIDTDGEATFAGTSSKDITKCAARGMVLEYDTDYGKIARMTSIDDATTVQVEPAPDTDFTADATWRIRHPSMQRIFECLVVGHTLANSRRNTLTGSIRLKGTRPIPAPTLIAAT